MYQYFASEKLGSRILELFRLRLEALSFLNHSILKRKYSSAWQMNTAVSRYSSISPVLPKTRRRLGCSDFFIPLTGYYAFRTTSQISFVLSLQSLDFSMVADEAICREDTGQWTAAASGSRVLRTRGFFLSHFSVLKKRGRDLFF